MIHDNFFPIPPLYSWTKSCRRIQNFELAENYFELNKQQNLKRENLFYRICVCKKISYKYETVAASVDVTKHSQTSSLDFRKKVELCSVVKP